MEVLRRALRHAARAITQEQRIVMALRGHLDLGCNEGHSMKGAQASSWQLRSAKLQ
jgi:hypothetical protein